MSNLNLSSDEEEMIKNSSREVTDNDTQELIKDKIVFKHDVEPETKIFYGYIGDKSRSEYVNMPHVEMYDIDDETMIVEVENANERMIFNEDPEKQQLVLKDVLSVASEKHDDRFEIDIVRMHEDLHLPHGW